MSWRTVVITKKAKLDLRLGSMVVRGEETKKVHLSEISILLIEHTAVSMTAALLCELMNRKVKVIFCDEARNPSAELIPYYGSHDTSAKLRAQFAWDPMVKEEVWTAIVYEKILQQRDVLLQIGKTKAAEVLGQYLKDMQPGDASNREGHAAKVYFGALFGISHARATENAVNAALNYGYGILLSAFNREIVSNGYITQIGIHHDNVFNPFNFGSDLMEPFRPLIDYHVYQHMPEEFGKSDKMRIIDILNQKVKIGGNNQYVNNAIKIYSKSVFDALNKQDLSLLRFYTHEF